MAEPAAVGAAAATEPAAATAGAGVRAPQEILVAVDDSNNSQLMFDWVVTNAVQPGDRVHLLHVTLKDPDSSATGSNLPHSDYFEQSHPQTAHRVAVAMLEARFLSELRAACPGVEPVVHIVQASLDPRTVGRIVCTKADELRIAHVYVAGAERSRLVQLLAGSVPSYVRAGCKAPLTIVSREQLGGGGGGGA